MGVLNHFICFREGATLAVVITTLNVNTVCLFMAHQPKLPDTAKKLRKF
ncbi:MAG: cyclic lactone autoinducer peptide [Clostridia bacterium]|nr:cyclic lactone autoinducer peptide [Clostridia bacterium]